MVSKDEESELVFLNQQTFFLSRYKHLHNQLGEEGVRCRLVSRYSHAQKILKNELIRLNENLLKILISLRTLFESTKFENAVSIFLIATSSLVTESFAANTIP